MSYFVVFPFKWQIFQLLRAFPLSLVYAKRRFFLVFLTQKLAPSKILNAIIFCTDEQCNLIFETALFTNCKIYIFFYSSGAHFLFFIVFLISISSLSHHFSTLSLPLLDLSASLSDETQARASSQANFFFYFIHSTLSLCSIFLFPLSLLSSLFSLCASPLSGLRRWLCSDDCGMSMAVV